MSRLKELIRELKRGRYTEENLGAFYQELADLYDEDSAFTMSLYDVMLFEMTSGSLTYAQMPITLKTQILEMNHIIRDVVLTEASKEKLEAAVEKVGTIRASLIARMDQLTSYNSYLTALEYVWNRSSLNPEARNAAARMESVDIDAETRRVLEKIFSSGDNTQINYQVQAVVSELPVRMTRKKFADYITAGLSVYREADQAALAGAEDMIRSAGCIGVDAWDEIYYPELSEKLHALDGEEMAGEATAEKLEELSKELQEAGDLVQMMTQMLNPLYVQLLVRPYTKAERNPAADLLLAMTSEAFLDADSPYADYAVFEEGIEEHLKVMEGRAEELKEMLAQAEMAFADARETERPLAGPQMLGNEERVLVRCSRLSSGSTFADLEETVSGPVSEKMLDETGERLEEAFREAFKGMSRPMRRAVMASVLGFLPVFFGNRTEVMEFVRGALLDCGSKEELAGSLAQIVGAVFYDEN